MSDSALAKPIVSLSEAQAFARLETGDEEALLAGMVRTASGLCEAFLNQVVIAREFIEELPASTSWRKLNALPVRSIEEVSSNGETLPPNAFETDIDAHGHGWVRMIQTPVAGPVQVTGSAGIAASQNGVPEPIRHGVLRLAAHLFAARDGSGGELPAAVTALWRPYRRMRIA